MTWHDVLFCFPSQQLIDCTVSSQLITMVALKSFGTLPQYKPEEEIINLKKRSLPSLVLDLLLGCYYNAISILQLWPRDFLPDPDLLP